MSTQELSKNLMCIVIRGGVEIWVEAEKLENLKAMIQAKELIQIGNNIINPVDISGIFEAKEMEDRNRRKNGQYKCQHGFWHEKFDQCGHRSSKG